MTHSPHLSTDGGPLGNAPLEAAQRVHSFLMRSYWDGSGLVGPDMGIRLNYRAGRFAKSTLRFLPWRDDLYYMQAQAYWELANWRLHAVTGEQVYGDVALACADRMLAGQRQDGGWDYPNPAWKGRTATTEGTWASIGLLEAYRETNEERYIEGARRWRHFLEEEMKFQNVLGGSAVNYFAGRVGAVVPNCSSLVLHFLAELAAVGDGDAADRCSSIVTFLRGAQKPNGELPYSVSSPVREARLEHFQCYQYNAFECLDLIRYLRVSGDESVVPIISGLLRFLREGLAPDGHALYQCGQHHNHVMYHSAALGAAFAAAGLVGEAGYEDDARRACTYVLSRQRKDGSFVHSQGDYRVLSDRRPYPRALSMIHAHLLVLGGVDHLGPHEPARALAAPVATEA